MSEPKLFTRSYIDGDSAFTVSSGSNSIQKIYDRDNDSQWISDSEDLDSTESIVQVDFKENGQSVSRTIDRVILVNHNLKNPILEYWDGATWQSLDSETGLTDGTCTVFEFVAVSTTKIRLRNSATISANAEKAVGEFIACASLIEFTGVSQELSTLEPSFNQRSVYELQMADGGLNRSVVLHSPNRTEKYECRAQMQFLTSAQITILQSIKAQARAFLWQPESVSRPADIFLVHWTGLFRPKYAAGYKGAGFTLDFELKEA